MNQNQVIERLKKEVSENPAANAVFYVFALRQRARSIITMSGLTQRMQAEGFAFKRADYARLLRLMADLQIGRLEVDANGHPKALKDIRVTLQSIGHAVLGHAKELKPNKRRNRYQKVTAPTVPITAGTEVAKEMKKLLPASITGVQVVLNGKTVTIPVPKEFDQKDIMSLVEHFARGGEA